MKKNNMIGLGILVTVAILGVAWYLYSRSQNDSTTKLLAYTFEI